MFHYGKVGLVVILALFIDSTYSQDGMCPRAPDDDSFESPVRSAPDHISCSPGSLSCSSTAAGTCCSEGSSGLMLSTQFWDYNPGTGPSDVFTLHGLWSNKCAGGYEQFCNPSWEITNATEVLEGLGGKYLDLLSTMQTNWKNSPPPDEDLWLHEFNKHGTCMSSVSPSCYDSDAAKYQYVGDFYETAVSLWQELPTYQWLQEAGITPSTTATYTSAQIIAALSSHVNGEPVYIACDKSNALQEVWYGFYLNGDVATGTFVPADPQTAPACPSTGIHFYPKTSGGGGGGGGPSSKGTLTLSGQSGCIISNGKWYTTGTCASFTLAPSSFGGVTLTSSKGPCDVVSGVLSCASGNTAAQFTQSGSSIIYGGNSQWSASSVPSGTQQQTISPGNSGPITFVLNFVAS